MSDYLTEDFRHEGPLPTSHITGDPRGEFITDNIYMVDFAKSLIVTFSSEKGGALRLDGEISDGLMFVRQALLHVLSLTKNPKQVLDEFGVGMAWELEKRLKVAPQILLPNE